VKREKPEPLLDDVSLCVQMGWTHGELVRQPTRFVEKLRIYLDAVAYKEERERRRLEEEIGKLRRRR
jgi:hypothetical protein